MPVELAWFLGSVLMLAGATATWIFRLIRRRNLDALRSRVEVTGLITDVDPPSSEDLGDRGCTVRYTIDGYSYKISAELEPKHCKLGQSVSVMVLPSMPSDGVLLKDLAPVSLVKPLALFAFGAGLVAWGFVERLLQ